MTDDVLAAAIDARMGRIKDCDETLILSAAAAGSALEELRHQLDLIDAALNQSDFWAASQTHGYAPLGEQFIIAMELRISSDDIRPEVHRRMATYQPRQMTAPSHDDMTE